MSELLPLFVDKTILPTGKYHVSYSEVSTCSGPDGCGFRHKLKYIDGHAGSDTEHTTYGKTMHTALQEWLLENQSVWFDWDKRIEQCQEEVRKIFESINFSPSEKEMEKDWIAPVKGILSQIPGWMDETFPEWEPIAAEIQLFEPIEGHVNKWFKGFIDAVIKVPRPQRKGSRKPATGSIYWILDWKVTSWGWDSHKKQDKFKRMQLALYKHYLSKKLDIPLDDIKCGFVILKRTNRKEQYCELLEVSVGDKTRLEAVEVVSKTVSMIARKWWMKNRNACKWCEFANTPLCP